MKKREEREKKRFSNIIDFADVAIDGDSLLREAELCAKASLIESEITVGCPTNIPVKRFERKIENINTYNALKTVTHGRPSISESVFNPINSSIIKMYLTSEEVRRGIDIFQDIITRVKIKEQEAISEAMAREQESVNYTSLLVPDLKKIAKSRKLTGYSNKKRDELIKMLREDDLTKGIRLPMRGVVLPEELEQYPEDVQCAQSLFTVTGVAIEHFRKQLRRNVQAIASVTSGGKSKDEIKSDLLKRTDLDEIRDVGTHLKIFDPLLGDGKSPLPQQVLDRCNKREKSSDLILQEAGRDVIPSIIDDIFDDYLEKNPEIEEAIEDPEEMKDIFNKFVDRLVAFPFKGKAEKIPNIGGLNIVMNRRMARNVKRAGKKEI